MDAKTIRELSRIGKAGALRSVLTALFDWGIVIAAATLAARLGSPWAWMLAALVIARQQHAFALDMHEAAHSRLFDSRGLNDWVGQYLFGSPIFFSLTGYRHLHLQHHQGPMSATDPDLNITGGYPIDRASLRRKLIRDVTGRTFPKIVRFYNSPPARFPARDILIVQALIATVMTWIAGPWGYPLLYLLPLVTILMPMLRLRAIVEHAGLENHTDQALCSRTIRPSWQTWILAPHHASYHAEHHRYPGVPFYRLPKLHRILVSEGSAPTKTYFDSYAPVLRSLVKGRNALARAHSP